MKIKYECKNKEEAIIKKNELQCKYHEFHNMYGYNALQTLGHIEQHKMLIDYEINKRSSVSSDNIAHILYFTNEFGNEYEELRDLTYIINERQKGENKRDYGSRRVNTYIFLLDLLDRIIELYEQIKK